MFAQFIAGLLAALSKKNGWTLSEHAGHVTAKPDAVAAQRLGGDADRLSDAVRDYVITHLGGEDASPVIDDTRAQKKGTKSVGVTFQRCGLTSDAQLPDHRHQARPGHHDARAGPRDPRAVLLGAG
ncbi:transposase [Streptomyces sp. DSM 40750]|uniref:transposase n=1 Tax=Streptomyces sp. DSM 40750 TaxID=2801030 RepID=UPI003FA778CB